MRFAKTSLRNVFCDVTIGAAIGLAGCGNTCFFGFVNTGTGVVVVGATSPPPCSLAQGKAAMNAVAVKSAVCETCTADARVEDAFVTVQRVQLHRVVPDDPGKDWLEIAPELASEPRQVDLVGDSPPEMLVENRIFRRTPMTNCAYDSARIPVRTRNVTPRLPAVERCGTASRWPMDASSQSSGPAIRRSWLFPLELSRLIHWRFCQTAS